MVSPSITNAIIAHLKQLYYEYLQTKDIGAKSHFFSPECRQICRPTPQFAARDRSTIVRYLHETSGKDPETIQNIAEDPSEGCDADSSVPQTSSDASDHRTRRSYCTIRPLRGDELDFGTDEVVRPAGFASTAEVKQKAERESWVGMRVDLWDDEGDDGAGDKKGILVKVQYWWRKEGDEWRQILHDTSIMYLGQRDGTEDNEGEIREQSQI